MNILQNDNTEGKADKQECQPCDSRQEVDIRHPRIHFGVPKWRPTLHCSFKIHVRKILNDKHQDVSVTVMFLHPSQSWVCACVIPMSQKHYSWKRNAFSVWPNSCHNPPFTPSCLPAQQTENDIINLYITCLSQLLKKKWAPIPAQGPTPPAISLLGAYTSILVNVLHAGHGDDDALLWLAAARHSCRSLLLASRWLRTVLLAALPCLAHHWEKVIHRSIRWQLKQIGDSSLLHLTQKWQQFLHWLIR